MDVCSLHSYFASCPSSTAQKNPEVAGIGCFGPGSVTCSFDLSSFAFGIGAAFDPQTNRSSLACLGSRTAGSASNSETSCLTSSSTAGS